jgi:hypothetical protein
VPSDREGWPLNFHQQKGTKQPELNEFRAIVGETSDFESSSNRATIAKGRTERQTGGVAFLAVV